MRITDFVEMSTVCDLFIMSRNNPVHSTKAPVIAASHAPVSFMIYFSNQSVYGPIYMTAKQAAKLIDYNNDAGEDS